MATFKYLTDPQSLKTVTRRVFFEPTDKKGMIIPILSVSGDNHINALTLSAEDEANLAGGATGISVGIFNSQGSEISATLTKYFAESVDLSVPYKYARLHRNNAVDYFLKVCEIIEKDLGKVVLDSRKEEFWIGFKLGANITKAGCCELQLQYV